MSARGRATSAAVLALSLLACASEQPPPPGPSTRAEPGAAEPGVLRMAGSGALGPMMRALSKAFLERAGGHPALRPLVEDGIGSGGGIRAVADGAVDLGLVSRPLTAAEQGLGLVLFPVGVDAVVIAANAELPLEEVSRPLLRDLFAGDVRKLPDGTVVNVLLRDPGESANLTLDAAVPGMTEARARGALRGFRVLYRDEAMAVALFGSRNALGLSSLALLGESRLPLKALRIDGQAASVEALGAGRWPLPRKLWVAMRPERVARVQPFLDFVASGEGRARILAAGYQPAGAASP